MSMYIKDEKGKYISILADGKFHETVSEGTEDAQLRKFETSDGKEGSKWEMVYKQIKGTIMGIDFHDGEYGKNIQLRISGDEGECIISVNTASNFGEDIMKKLPNVDFSKPLTFAPFAFLDENERNVRGVTFWQGSDKVPNFFKDAVTKELLNGFPAPDKDKDYDKDDWKVYFINIRKFLIQYTIDNVIPKLGNVEKPQEDNFSQVIDETTVPSKEADAVFRASRTKPIEEKKADITKFRPKFYPKDEPKEPAF